MKKITRRNSLFRLIIFFFAGGKRKKPQAALDERAACGFFWFSH